MLVQMSKKRSALTPGAISLLQKGRRLTEHTLNTCQLKRVKAAAVRFLIHSFFDSSNSFLHSFLHSLLHSYIHTFIHSFVHSFIRSFIHSCKSQVSSPGVRYVQPWVAPWILCCCAIGVSANLVYVVNTHLVCLLI